MASSDKAVEKIDFLLNVFNDADKAEHGQQDECCGPETKKTDECCGPDTKKTCCDMNENVQFFKSTSDVKTGMNVRITSDPKFLGKLWDEAGLGPMDELESLCNVIGCIQEIEESDNTVELRWENYDTAWIPVKACSDAGDSKPTLPGVHTSWLSPDNEENKNSDEEEQEEQQEEQQEETEDETQIKYFVSVEDRYLKEGVGVRVTKNLDLLEEHWTKSKLESNDTKYNYLGLEGVVELIDEDYDTIQIRAGSETIRLPVQACYAAPGTKSAF